MLLFLVERLWMETFVTRKLLKNEYFFLYYKQLNKSIDA